MNIKTKTVVTLPLKVNVVQIDIDDGECRIPALCMQKIAVARAITREFPNEQHNKLFVRVDAGHIKFNLQGYRWEADTPKVARVALHDFDKGRPVRPHSYKIEAVRKNKITPMTSEAKANILASRERAAKTGGKRNTAKNAIRRRVVGFDLGRH